MDDRVTDIPDPWLRCRNRGCKQVATKLLQLNCRTRSGRWHMRTYLRCAGHAARLLGRRKVDPP